MTKQSDWRFEPDKGIRSSDRPDVLDVQQRHKDVRRIGRSLPAYRLCLELGWMREELDQELLVRCYRRQSMASRYDPKRGSVSKYLMVFCRGTLLNLAQIRQRRARHEQVGVIGRDGVDADAAVVAFEIWDGE